MPRIPHGPQRIGNFLEVFFRNKGWSSKIHEYRIWTHWEKVVGPKLAEHCIPLKLHLGKLTIAVSSSTWLTELQFMKDTLIQKIGQSLGVYLKEIYWVTRPFPKPISKIKKPPPPLGSATLRPSLSKSSFDFIDKNSGLDPDLKETLKRILQKQTQVPSPQSRKDS